ncbi:MAG: TRAP transporter large permease [Actinomycetota bacterium]|nr:TRAP transporter large permease [Actinomycetota bacterium]
MRVEDSEEPSSGVEPPDSDSAQGRGLGRWIPVGLVAALVAVATLLLNGGDSPVTVGVLALVLMLLLLAMKVPVAVAMMAAAVAGYAVIVGFSPALARFGSDAFREAASYNLSVIPLYVLMGLLLASAGLGKDLYTALGAFLWRLRGGLAPATIGASALFGAVSGSAVASATTMSIVAVPEMRRHNYDAPFSAACAAVGGTLGILIPPSAILVLYGVLTEESIGQVLIAGIVPGLMTTVLLMVTASVVVWRNPNLAPEKLDSSPVSKLRALGLVWAVPVIFGASMGGLYLGVFTPTESGAVGAFLALVYGVLTRRLDLMSFLEAVSRTIRTSALIFLLVIAGKMLGFFLSITRIPREIGEFIGTLDVAPVLVLTAIFVIYFIGGALMDEIALLVIMTPIFYPIVIGLGYNGIWFGVLSIMMLLTGLLTPPIGLLTFVVSGITKIPLGQVYRAVTPFWMTLVLAIFLVILFPTIATILPDLMR